jgi:hypothetical protein
VPSRIFQVHRPELWFLAAACQLLPFHFWQLVEMLHLWQLFPVRILLYSSNIILHLSTGTDAATEGVVASSSLVLMLLGFAAILLLPYAAVWGGCVLVLLASGYYLEYQERDQNESLRKGKVNCF